jgi:hypothetical protein
MRLPFSNPKTRATIFDISAMERYEIVKSEN